MSETSDFRETLYTVDSQGNRKWVYAAQLYGYFKKRRAVVGGFLILLYISLPWIPINGTQAVFLDIANRRFTFFGTTFWATDTIFMLLTLASLGVSLFFFTSLFGRVWCGWACPQTVFLDFIFRPIEHFIEGPPSRRQRLDAAGWTKHKILIKGTKFLVFAFICWWMASTALAYFIGRPRLIAMITDYPWNNWSTFLLTWVLMSVLLFEFGWFREQFCTVLCPYARFQSVLLDDTSVVIGYDTVRGEPRGKGSDEKLGDCVDCGLCVRVCPTGIDIRNGLQLECVQCAACVDACDSIMTKLSRKTGLVRYSTERGLKGEPVRIFRPRVIAYGSILIGLATLFVLALSSRQPTDAILLHSRDGELFQRVGNGRIMNHLELQLSNKSEVPRQYTVKIPTESGLELTVPLNPYPLGPNGSAKVPLFISFPEETLKDGKRNATVSVEDSSGFKKEMGIELVGPG